MAAGTFATGLEAEARVWHARLIVKSVMTLQAKLAALAPYQQHAIRAAMRIVAGGAAFHFGRGMLIQIWPALFRMAFYASLKVRRIETGHGDAGGIPAAVRIMAVGTLHQLLRNAMMNGESKLGFDGSVAAEAQPWFGFFQEAVVQPSHFFRQSRNLEEISLGIGQVTLALIFDLLDQMSGMALIA